MLDRFLWEERSIAPLVVFRILFGLLALISSVRFIRNDWIEALFGQSQFYFKYTGFSWVPVLSVEEIYLLFYLMIVASLGILFGFAYRLSIAFFFLAFTFVDLMDASNYLNHHYLFSLLAFLLIFLPANRFFSIDCLLRPSIRRTKVPALCRNILLFQIALVYLFAGLAKINPDWLLHGMPLAVWLPEHQHLPIIGEFLTQKSTAVLFSWMGMLYDCSIVFFLLYKPSRSFAFAGVVLFHGMTWLFFNIGLFPFIMVGCSLLFFSDSFHQRLLQILGADFDNKQSRTLTTGRSFFARKVIPFALCIYVAVQVLLPLRHLAYEGDAKWTEEGYRFSWRVMLLEKSGMVSFTVVNAETGQRDEVQNNRFLTDFQVKQMAIQPEFILQFAHFLEEHYQEEYLWKEVEIYANSQVAINASTSRSLIDPQINLLNAKNHFIRKYAVNGTQ